MALITGTHLGPYEVLTPIGAGGMGEVYQAHDTKLGRDVAIKVLPEAFAHDPERLSRFQREAKMLAALNHPNIATIYGLEQSSGTSLLVMELVPGETLAERIKRDGAVPVEEALAIAKQIAEALEAAHEKSIIHRDLKPANVKVTPEGKVKVLDFGLAKAFAGDSTSTDPSESPHSEYGRDDAGRDPGDSGVHVARAGGGQSSRQALGYVGVRLPALRVAHRKGSVSRGRFPRYSGFGGEGGTGF